MVNTKSPWIFCLPALLILILVVAYPLTQTFYFAFTDARLSNLDRTQWIGFENFIYLCRDPDWWKALWNTLIFTLCSVSLETLLGLIFALTLNHPFIGRRLFQTSILIPWAIPALVTAKIWAWMLNDLYGILNQVLLNLGLIEERIAWLASSKLTLLTLVLVDVWKTTPFMTLLILAGLQSVPNSVIEAAIMDGIPPIQRFFRITFPLIRPAILIAVIFRTLDALRIFDLPYVLTSNSKSTAVLSTYVRQQMVDFQEIGYGSAGSFIVFLVIGALAMTFIKTGQKSLKLET